MNSFSLAFAAAHSKSPTPTALAESRTDHLYFACAANSKLNMKTKLKPTRNQSHQLCQTWFLANKAPCVRLLAAGHDSAIGHHICTKMPWLRKWLLQEFPVVWWFVESSRPSQDWYFHTDRTGCPHLELERCHVNLSNLSDSALRHVFQHLQCLRPFSYSQDCIVHNQAVGRMCIGSKDFNRIWPWALLQWMGDQTKSVHPKLDRTKLKKFCNQLGQNHGKQTFGDFPISFTELDDRTISLYSNISFRSITKRSGTTSRPVPYASTHGRRLHKFLVHGAGQVYSLSCQKPNPTAKTWKKSLKSWPSFKCIQTASKSSTKSQNHTKSRSP